MSLLSLHKHSVPVAAMLMLTPAASMAIVYECKSDQALIWHHGRFGPYQKGMHIDYQFDDNNGVLSMSKPSEGRFQLRVFTRLDPHNDLVADSLEMNKNKDFVSNIYFRISSWGKKVGMVFMFSGSHEIASGHCAVSQEMDSLTPPQWYPSEILLPPPENEAPQTSK